MFTFYFYIILNFSDLKKRQIDIKQLKHMLQKDCDHAILLFVLKNLAQWWPYRFCLIIHKSFNWQYFSLMPKVNSPLKSDLFLVWEV